METIIAKIETLAEYKKAMKTFVRGVIKSKIFADDKNAVEFKVAKESGDALIVEMSASNEFNTALFTAEVSTRVFNKIKPELYTKTIEQFNKLKGFGGMTVTVEED